VCELLRPEAAARGIEIDLRIDPNLPPMIADPSQLTQALLNLVINAIQAVEGAGRVEVRGRAEEAREFVALEIRDTGPGVPVERQSAIFEPFFTTRAEGSGVGLWVVQQIVMAHGGEVAVANAPGSGAVFTVRLPVVREEAPHG